MKKDTEFKNAILNIVNALRENADSQRWSVKGSQQLQPEEQEQCTQYIRQQSYRLEELANNEMGFNTEELKNHFDTVMENLRNGFGPGQRCHTSIPQNLIDTVENLCRRSVGAGV